MIWLMILMMIWRKTEKTKGFEIYKKSSDDEEYFWASIWQLEIKRQKKQLARMIRPEKFKKKINQKLVQLLIDQIVSESNSSKIQKKQPFNDEVLFTWLKFEVLWIIKKTLRFTIRLMFGGGWWTTNFCRIFKMHSDKLWKIYDKCSILSSCEHVK